MQAVKWTRMARGKGKGREKKERGRTLFGWRLSKIKINVSWIEFVERAVEDGVKSSVGEFARLDEVEAEDHKL